MSRYLRDTVPAIRYPLESGVGCACLAIANRMLSNDPALFAKTGGGDALGGIIRRSINASLETLRAALVAEGIKNFRTPLDPRKFMSKTVCSYNIRNDSVMVVLDKIEFEVEWDHAKEQYQLGADAATAGNVRLTDCRPTALEEVFYITAYFNNCDVSEIDPESFVEWLKNLSADIERLADMPHVIVVDEEEALQRVLSTCTGFTNPALSRLYEGLERRFTDAGIIQPRKESVVEDEAAIPLLEENPTPGPSGFQGRAVRSTTTRKTRAQQQTGRRVDSSAPRAQHTRFSTPSDDDRAPKKKKVLPKSKVVVNSSSAGESDTDSIQNAGSSQKKGGGGAQGLSLTSSHSETPDNASIQPEAIQQLARNGTPLLSDDVVGNHGPEVYESPPPQLDEVVGYDPLQCQKLFGTSGGFIEYNACAGKLKTLITTYN